MTALGHVLEHRAATYRRTFRASAFTSFLSPILFLTAMGLGLGGYVDRGGSAALGGLTYLQFLATGRLLQRFGVGRGAALLPLVFALGFVVLAFSPVLAVVIAFQAIQRTATGWFGGAEHHDGRAFCGRRDGHE